jgi:hypothetical protein
MAFDKAGLDTYNDVASRMAEFFTKHPEGSLQPANPGQPFEVRLIGDHAFVVYTAAAYRTPDDTRPGIGIAWEPFPGRTPYTKDSEVQNAETSAWGRAILAVGAADTRKGVASAEEVRNRQADREEWEQATPAQPRPAQPSRAELVDAGHQAITAATSVDVLAQLRARVDANTLDNLITMADAQALHAAINGREAELTGNRIDDPAQPIGDAQRRRMFALFSQVGLTDRDRQLEFLSRLAGQPLDSRRDVTADVADQAIAAMEAQLKQGAGSRTNGHRAVPA